MNNFDPVMRLGQAALQQQEQLIERVQQSHTDTVLDFDGHLKVFDLQAELAQLAEVMAPLLDRTADEKDFERLGNYMHVEWVPTAKKIIFQVGDKPTLDFRIHRSYLSMGRYQQGKRRTILLTRSQQKIADLKTLLIENKDKYIVPENHDLLQAFNDRLLKLLEKIRQRDDKRGLVEKIRMDDFDQQAPLRHTMQQLQQQIAAMQQTQAAMQDTQLTDAGGAIDGLVRLKQNLPKTAAPAAGAEGKLPLAGTAPFANDPDPLSWVTAGINAWTFADLVRHYQISEPQLAQALARLQDLRGEKARIRFLVILVQSASTHAAWAQASLQTIFSELHVRAEADPVLDMIDYYNLLTADLMLEFKAKFMQAPALPDTEFARQMATQLRQSVPAATAEQSLLATHMLHQAMRELGISPDEGIPEDKVLELTQSLSRLLAAETAKLLTLEPTPDDTNV